MFTHHKENLHSQKEDGVEEGGRRKRVLKEKRIECMGTTMSFYNNHPLQSSSAVCTI